MNPDKVGILRGEALAFGRPAIEYELLVLGGHRTTPRQEDVVLGKIRWRPWLGRRLHDFVSAHRKLWDTAMAILALGYVAIGTAEDPKQWNAADVVVWTLGAVFLLEFMLRLMDDPHPNRYVRDHWIDLVTCIPTIAPLRLLRLLRLLRVYNAASLVRKIARDNGDASSSAGIRVLGATIFVFWLAAGYAFYVTEHDQPHSMVQSFPDALFLAFTTSTSVGYSPMKPVTFEGQIIAGLVIFIGLGLLAAASSRLTSLWTEGSAEQDLKDLLRDLRDQVRSSEARLAAIEQALAVLGPGQSTPRHEPTRPSDLPEFHTEESGPTVD